MTAASIGTSDKEFFCVRLEKIKKQGPNIANYEVGDEVKNQKIEARHRWLQKAEKMFFNYKKSPEMKEKKI